jgi:hypothetical protein
MMDRVISAPCARFRQCHNRLCRSTAQDPPCFALLTSFLPWSSLLSLPPLTPHAPGHRRLSLPADAAAALHNSAHDAQALLVLPGSPQDRRSARASVARRSGQPSSQAHPAIQPLTLLLAATARKAPAPPQGSQRRPAALLVHGTCIVPRRVRSSSRQLSPSAARPLVLHPLSPARTPGFGEQIPSHSP